MIERHSAKEFLDKLRRDEIIRPVTLMGMVKKADDDAAHLMFSLGGTCSEWVAIPEKAIESVEVLDVIRCKDHTHPLVKLQLTQPTSEEACLYWSIARHALRAKPHRSSTPSRQRGGRGLFRREDAHPAGNVEA